MSHSVEDEHRELFLSVQDQVNLLKEDIASIEGSKSLAEVVVLFSRVRDRSIYVLNDLRGEL